MRRAFCGLLLFTLVCVMLAFHQLGEDKLFFNHYVPIAMRMIRKGLPQVYTTQEECETLSGKTCKNIRFDERNMTLLHECTATKTGWQSVTNNKSYVYSAHLMPESDDVSSQIQIIVTIRDNLFKKYVTKIKDVNYFVWIYLHHQILTSKCDVIRDARNSRIHKRVFNPGVLICDLPVGRSTLMNAMVSVVEGVNSSSDKPANCLPLLHQYLTEENKYNFTVCLGGPLRYANPRWFVEWIELNRLFGAEKVVIHDMGQTSELEPYLQYYSQLGILDLLDWRLVPGMTSTKPMPYWQQSSLTDCLLRLQRHSRFVVQNDLDELLVPRGADQFTWQEMISSSGCGWEKPSYEARHLYYERSGENINQTGLFSQKVVQRVTDALPYPTRGKYIANTWRVSFFGNHQPLLQRTTPQNGTCVLEVEQGAVHHYRACTNSRCVQHGSRLVDATLHKYNATISQRVTQVLNTVKNSH